MKRGEGAGTCHGGDPERRVKQLACVDRLEFRLQAVSWGRVGRGYAEFVGRAEPRKRGTPNVRAEGRVERLVPAGLRRDPEGRVARVGAARNFAGRQLSFHSQPGA